MMIGLIIGLIFVVVVGTLLIVAHTAQIQVPRVASWSKPPRVLVSRLGAVTLADVQTAMVYWQALGHVFDGPPQHVRISGETDYDNAIVICTEAEYGRLGGYLIDPADVGHATITMDLMGAPTIGGTRPQPMDALSQLQAQGYEIKLGIIAIRPRFGVGTADMTTILVHELGHALGFDHVFVRVFGMKMETSGHPMNPNLEDVGIERSEGLHR